MALGGGTFTVQNKILPGTYISFVSAANASAALSERGTLAIALPLSWGPEGKIFTVERAEAAKDALKIFGCPYTDEELKPVRELFRHGNKAHLFRLNAGGVKAQCTLAEARYPGSAGNKLRVVVAVSPGSSDAAPLYDVSVYLGAALVDLQQGVGNMADLADNGWLSWKKDGAFAETAGLPLTGGSDGEADDTVYQDFLDQAEGYTFHALGCLSEKQAVRRLFTDYTRRMREEVGKKFQLVCFREAADYEGVVSLKNGLAGDKESAALIPWVTGVIAGTAVNASAANLPYDGEYEPDLSFTQSQLEAGIKEGSFMLHTVDGKARVLEDINSFVSVTAEKSADFGDNQTIRVLDQIAVDIAAVFAQKYLGKAPNDAAGRISLWNDIVRQHLALQDIRAIENFKSEDVAVEPGESKRAVTVASRVTPVSAMRQLYMTVYVE